MGYHPSAFLCPEDEKANVGLPDVKIWAAKRGYYLEMFSAYPWWLESNAWEIVGGTPGVWKMNDEVYNATKPFIRERQGLVDRLVKYTPGINPKVYWYLFEDQRTGDDLWAGDDKDFEDLIIKVVETRGNSVMLTTFKGVTFHTFDLIGPDDTIFRNVGSGGPFFFEGVANVSYGMNWRAEHITSGLHKILVLDYEAEVCNVGAGAPLYPDQNWYIDRAPRHFNKANVLFGGGEVVMMSLDDINPNLDDYDAEYWDPKR